MQTERKDETERRRSQKEQMRRKECACKTERKDEMKQKNQQKDRKKMREKGGTDRTNVPTERKSKAECRKTIFKREDKKRVVDSKTE